MDIQHMRYVVAVARVGSVRAAATELFIAPQTLSEHLARAERELGTALFTRTRQGMVPTALGATFVAHATDALNAFDQAQDAIRAAASGRTPPVVVAWAYGLADVLRDFLQAVMGVDPDLPLRPVALGCAAQVEALARREITAGLTHYIPGTPTPAGLRGAVIDSQPTHALLAADNSLAARDHVTLDDLAAEPLLLPAESGTPCLRQWELEEFDRAGLQPRIGAEVSNIDLAIANVATGRGYALCVRTTHPVGPQVRFVPVSGVGPQQVALQWSGSLPSALARVVRQRTARS